MKGIFVSILLFGISLFNQACLGMDLIPSQKLEQRMVDHRVRKIEEFSISDQRPSGIWNEPAWNLETDITLTVDPAGCGVRPETLSYYFPRAVRKTHSASFQLLLQSKNIGCSEEGVLGDSKITLSLGFTVMKSALPLTIEFFYNTSVILDLVGDKIRVIKIIRDDYYK